MAELITDTTSDNNDDYSLEAVPEDKRMPWKSILNVTLGITGAMIFMQVAGEMAIAYGSKTAITAMVYATILNGILATIFAFFSAKTGLNSNLIARGAGYGFVGAAITSLIYASNFIVLAAIEGSIMSHAIHAYIPSIPVWVIMIILGIGIIPLNWYGMRQLNKFQKYSLPVYIILLVSGIIIALNMDTVSALGNWLTFQPDSKVSGGIALLTCMGIFNGIIGLQTLLTADYARYIKPKEIKYSLLIGFAPQIGSYFIMGMVGIWFALRFAESNPGIYMVTVLGIGGAAYTVLSQLRINLINIYSGSLSLTNFFSRVLGFTPGRVFWVVVTAGLALVAMLSNVIDHIGPVLTFQGVSMFAWTASMIADLLIVKKVMKIGPSHIEYRQGYLRDWNPVGPIALLLGAAVGCYFALFHPGTIPAATSAFIAAAISFIAHIVLAAITKGKYYYLTEKQNKEGFSNIAEQKL